MSELQAECDAIDQKLEKVCEKQIKVDAAREKAKHGLVSKEEKRVLMGTGKDSKLALQREERLLHEELWDVLDEMYLLQRESNEVQERELMSDLQKVCRFRDPLLCPTDQP